MKLLDLLSDYGHAVSIAAEGRLHRVPRSLYSVLSARTRYDIGPRFHSLFDLIRIPRSQWPEFLIDTKLKHVLRRVNPTEAREVVNDKIEFHRHCAARGLRTIPILCTFDTRPGAPTSGVINGLDPARWCEALERGPDRLFIKLIDGSWGVDAFVAQRSADGWQFAEERGSLADLHAFCGKRLGGRRGWIVQPLVRNHRELLRIMSPSALGTVRAVTCFTAGEPQLLYAVLRMPVGDNRVDNFAHGASGNLTASIDLGSGTVSTARGSRDKRWPTMMDVECHPDTRQRISGFRLPFWPDTERLIIQAHRSLPRLKTLGWDVAVTDEGPVLVEANATYDVDLLQVSYKRGLKSELFEHTFGM